MPEDAVVDAGLEPGLDTGGGEDTTLDTGADAGADVSAIDASAGDEPGADPDAPAVEDGPAVLDGKKLAPAAAKLIQDVAKTQPKLAREIRRALFQADQISRELPEGFQTVARMRQTIEDLGGEQGLQTIRQELNGWSDFDKKFTAGDPSAIDFMTETAEGKTATLKLMPHVLQKFADLHPAGFAQYFAQVMESDMVAARVPLMLERLQDLVGENPRAVQELQRLQSYFQRIGQVAQSKVEHPKFEAERQPDPQLNDREDNLRRQEWRVQAQPEQSAVFNSKWNEMAAGRKLTTQQSDAIKELYGSRMSRALAQYKPQLDRLFANKDQEGWKRLASKISRDEIPKALRAAFDAILPGKPGPRPASAVPQPRAGAPQQVRTPGVAAIAKAPPSSEIDYTHPFNTQSNYLRGEAVLKSGKKVTWKR
jgi:hypothetical protein